MNSLDSVIIVLYGLIVAFFLYRIVKHILAKKNIEGEVRAFKKPTSSFEIILIVILVITGGVNVYYGYKQGNNQSILTALVMLLLALVFYISSRLNIYVAENGILANSKFSTYKQIKKWGFDTDSGDIVILVKDKMGESRESTKVRKEDIEEINTLIRRYKLGK